MRFEDFILQLEVCPDGGLRARVLQSPFGEGAARFSLSSLDAPEPASTESSRRGSRHLSAEGATETVNPRSPLGAGSDLFRSVFQGLVGTLLHKSLGQLESSPGLGLRLKIKLDPGDEGLGALADLPWELLFDADREDFFALSRQTSLVRHLDVPRPFQPIPFTPPLRILAVAAGPHGLEPLDLAEEVRRIKELHESSPGIEVRFLEHASVGAVREALSGDTYNVLHFMGHGLFDPLGGEGMLAFEAMDGSPELVSGKTLATKLKDLRSLGVVVLNACETARAGNEGGLNPFRGVAGALVFGGVPAVVAMQQPISDLAAISFGTAFYRHLARGDSIDEALTEGRQAIHSASPEQYEWAIPVLFLRTPEGHVFEAQRAATELAVEPVEPVQARPQIYFREPYPRPADFTGRSSEKSDLRQWLLDPTDPIFIWSALGGQGKTTLVSNWLDTEPALAQGWKGVIWWSFYTPASLPDEFVRHALTWILGTCPEGAPRQLFTRLVEELREKRFLLVLDGIERLLRGYTGVNAIGSIGLDVTLEGEERSFSDPNLDWFLVASAQQPAVKILITTRDVPHSLENLKGCRVGRLRDLPSDEAVAYLTSAGVSGEPRELEEVFALYGRHPLGLKLLAGLVAKDLEAPGELKALRKYQLIPNLRDKLGGHQRHHILEHAYRSMPASSRGLIEHLSLYRIPVDYPKLRVFAAHFPLNDAVIDLETRGFVERVEKTERAGVTFDMHPIVRQYAQRSFLTTDPEGLNAAHRLIAKFFQIETREELRDEFLVGPPQEERYVGPARTDADSIHGVADIALVVELVHHLLASGDQNRAIVLLRDRLARLLVYKFKAFGLLKDLLDPVCFSPTAAAGVAEPLRPANDKQAWALNILANSYRNCVSACQAAVLHEIVAAWDRESSERLFAVRMVNLAIDQHLIGDFQQAEKNLLACLEISRRLGQLESNEISCLRELGDLYTRLGRFPEAATLLEEALQLARSQTSREETGILINQAHLHLAQGDPFRALDLAKEATSASKRFNEPGRLDERHAIALCLTMGAPNRLEEAKGLLKEALHDSGNASLTAMRAQILLALAQCSSGPEEKNLARQALRLAVQGDYVPLEADVYAALGRLALLSNDLDAAQRHGARALTRSRQRKDPRTRQYRDIPADSPHRYELGHRRATELLRQIAFSRR